MKRFMRSELAEVIILLALCISVVTIVGSYVREYHSTLRNSPNIENRKLYWMDVKDSCYFSFNGGHTDAKIAAYAAARDSLFSYCK